MAEHYFEVVNKNGLGKVLRCKICYYKYNKDFVVISLKDAERHLQYHYNKFEGGRR